MQAPGCQRNGIDRHEREDMRNPKCTGKIHDRIQPQDTAEYSADNGKGPVENPAGNDQEQREKGGDSEPDPVSLLCKGKETYEKERENERQIMKLMIGNEHSKAQRQKQHRVGECFCFAFAPEQPQNEENSDCRHEMIQDRQLEETEMTHRGAVRIIMINPSRLEQDPESIKIAGVNLLQAVPAEDGRNGEKDEKGECRNAELPVPFEEQERGKDGKHAVFHCSNGGKESRAQDLGCRPPKHPVQAKRQNNGNLTEAHRIQGAEGGQKTCTAQHEKKLLPARHPKIAPFVSACFDQRQTGQIEDEEDVQDDEDDANVWNATTMPMGRTS